MIDESDSGPGPYSDEAAEDPSQTPGPAAEESDEGALVLPKAFFKGRECKAGDVISLRVTGMDSDGDYAVELDDGGDEEPDMAMGVKKAFESEPPSRDAMMALKKGIR